jgi:tetratricopeptide (TPR) repeat protein
VIRALAAFLLVIAPAVAAPQGAGNPFVVRQQPESAGGAAREMVTADRRALTCLDALRYLAAAMNWNLHLESDPLANDLRFHTVDLGFVDQDPRVVGQLVAVAAGADMVFDDGNIVEGMRPTMHIVREPSGETASGRNRLRANAAQWYRSFLVDDLQHEPVVVNESMRVRMDLGRLLIESGDLEAAMPLFLEVFESRSQTYSAAAVLRLANAEIDLGRGSRDPQEQMEHFREAQKWAEQVTKLRSNSIEMPGAVIALGHALLGLARAADDPADAERFCMQCKDQLEKHIMRLVESPQMIDVWLLVGEANYMLQGPELVQATMQKVSASSQFDELDDRQLLDYHYLLGYGALGNGQPGLAVKSLEWFLIHCEADPRRGIANVLLADAYLQTDRFLQARAAAVAARQQHMADLDAAWRVRALRLWARTALALGDKETAFRELEVLVHRDRDPDLVLFLVDELIEDRQWQRAISAGRLLANGQGVHADQARLKTVLALFRQAKAIENLAEFPAQARELAIKIEDEQLRSQCAEMIGDAYTELGKLETAAVAYRGILR